MAHATLDARVSHLVYAAHGHLLGQSCVLWSWLQALDTALQLKFIKTKKTESITAAGLLSDVMRWQQLMKRAKTMLNMSCTIANCFVLHLVCDVLHRSWTRHTLRTEHRQRWSISDDSLSVGVFGQKVSFHGLLLQSSQLLLLFPNKPTMHKYFLPLTPDLCIIVP
jgi:hypothetical protein